MLGIDNWVQLSNEDDQNRSPKSATTKNFIYSEPQEHESTDHC